MHITHVVNSLLLLHILCGFTALFSSFVAMSVIKGGHQHRRFGSAFFYGMTGVFITAIPLALIKNNLFLFLIALFSYYLAFTGWRYAKNRSGRPSALDWGVSVAMLITSCLMLGAGALKQWPDSYQSTTLLVFGSIGAIFSVSDLYTFKQCRAIAKLRIVKHLSAMLGATIATLTAFAVTNIHIHPKIIVWLGPTVLIVPIIAWWKHKVLSGPKNLSA